MHPAEVVTILFGLAVAFGILVQFLQNPKSTVALFGATTQMVGGVTAGLEGRPFTAPAA